MKESLCFVGSNSLFSLVAFRTLLEKKINVRQIILAGFAPANVPEKNLPVASSTPTIEDSIPTLAEQYKIPIHYAGNEINNFDEWTSFSHRPAPDFLFVACFPFRLPSNLLLWPSKLAINLHPSLLPAYRGPDPIFWQLRKDETKTGFTLHLLTEALDEGPILLQKPVSFPQAASRNELDTLLAQQGSEALCDLLSTPILKPAEQDARTASYHPMPQTTDYALDTNWPAERAYNFICGTHTPPAGYPILLSGQQHIANAFNVEPQREIGKKYVQCNNEILIQFSPGVLHAKPV